MRHAFIVLFLVLVADSVSAAIQHPLTVSADGRSLLDATGSEIAFNAATPWHLVTRLTREETLEYIDVRASQEFNALLFSMIVSDGYSTGSVVNAYGEPPFTIAGDFGTPNAAYFDHVDWVLERMRERGMTAFLMPVYLGWGCGDEGWCDEVLAAGAAAMRDFGRWVGTRYRDQANIVWIHGGDVDAALFGAMDENDALVEGILEVDSNHLHTAHCSRFRSGVECYDRPWLDFNTTYSDCTRTPLDIREDYQRVPLRPFVYLEGHYEFENGATSECLRAQAYWSALGGAAGHFFGSGLVWDFPGNWRDGLETVGTASMYHFGRLLESRGWPSMVPDYAHQTVVSGYGSIDGSGYVASALSESRATLIAYVPTPRSITVALTRLTGTEVDATWLNPATGAVESVGRIPVTGTRQFATPPGTDWVLVIDDASADLTDVWDSPTSVAPEHSRLALVQLIGVSPNPFNPRTRIEFAGPAGDVLTLSVFDARGREIARLFEGPATGGPQSVDWQADGTASGVYFVRVSGAGSDAVSKLAVLK